MPRVICTERRVHLQFPLLTNLHKRLSLIPGLETFPAVKAHPTLRPFPHLLDILLDVLQRRNRTYHAHVLASIF